jgi:putative hemolysin
MAKVGDTLHQDAGYDMVVTEVDGRRIQTIEIRKSANDEVQAQGSDASDAKETPAKEDVANAEKNQK